MVLVAAISLALFASFARPAPGAEVAGPEPILTRQTEFSIPFRLAPPNAPDQAPVEVLLGVSVDQGRTWSLATTVKPDQKVFPFRAPHDGEYWFSIRTKDRQGRFHPDTPPSPELKVVVDTVVPRLDLSAIRGPAGEVLVQWQAVDPNLKLDSLTIEYQTNPNQPWEPLAIDPPQDPTRLSLVGQSSWWPKPGAGAITVRAQVLDRAGNPAVSQVQVKLDPARTAMAPSESQRPTNPPATPQYPTNQYTPSPPATNQPPAPSGVNWPAENVATAPMHGNAAPLTASRETDWRTASSNLGVATSGGAVVHSKTPAQGISHATNVGSVAPAGALDTSVLPPGERPRMVNSRTFELEYEIESIGPSGIGKVELWGTRDGGRTWASYGVDGDNRTPLVVQVESDGIYGFRIVVQSASGAGGDLPRSGDLPELWIGVDRTSPTAKIAGVEISKDCTEMQIRWEVSDELPDSRPISLLFSDRPGGPWTAFASGLENTGSYTWRLDNRVPEQLYLRLEARDEAGNLGAYDTTDPIPLDRQRPQGRLRSVRPVGQ